MKKSLWALGILYKASPIHFLFLVFITFISSIIPSISILLLSNLINFGLELGSSSIENFNWWIVVIAILYIGFTLVLPSALSFIYSFITEKVGRKSQQFVTEKILKHSKEIELDIIEDPRYQDLLSRVRGIDSKVLSDYWNNTLNALGIIIQLVSVSLVLFSFHWVVPILMVLAAIPELIIQKRTTKMQHQIFIDQSRNERLYQYFLNLFVDREAVKEIKSYSLGGFLIDKYLKAKNDYDSAHFEFEKKSSVKIGNGQFIIILMFSFITVVLTVITYLGKMTIGGLTSAIFAFDRMVNAITSFIHVINGIHKQYLLIDLLFDFLASKNTRNNTNNLLEKNLNNITFENVSFKYPNCDEYVLQDINLNIQHGEKIAIVGENGSGKSTLIRLLLGLSKPTEGKILINSEEIDHYSDQVTIVLQDYSKYYRTFRENIGYSDLDNLYSDQLLYDAANKTGVGDYILSNDQKLDTQLGTQFENGIDISGGQWQKLAISRAYFRQAELFVMDEPTAALDPMAEVQLYKQFIDLSQNKLAVIVSHRLGSARMADKIIVLKNGRIIEEGSHEYLMEKRGEYFKMFHAQASWYV